MPTVFELMRTGHTMRLHARQYVTTGVVAGFDQGRVKVVSGQHTFQAETGIAQELKKGDRVYIVQGRGVVKIVGLLGADSSG